MCSRRVYGTLFVNLGAYRSHSAAYELDFHIDGRRCHDVKTNIISRRHEGDSEVIDFSCMLPKEVFDEKFHKIDLSFKNSNLLLNNKSFTIGPGNFDSRIEHIGGGRIAGYFVERVAFARSQVISITIDADSPFEVDCDQIVLNSFSSDPIQNIGGFSFQLEKKYLDGLPHQVTMRHEGLIVNTTYVLFAQLSHLDSISASEISGWIYDSSVAAESPAIDMDLYIDGEIVDAVRANLRRGDVGRACGFHANINEYTKNKASFSLTLTLAGTSQAVLKTPIVYNRRDSFIEIIRTIAEKARVGELGLNAIESIAFSRYLSKKIISDLRHSELEHAFVTEEPGENARLVNVIVPVYDGIAETAKCLAELFGSRQRNKTEFQVTIIDDCGPEPAMRALLDEFSHHNSTHLIANERNLGFVSSVNKALALSKGHDVVLLNADAVVANDWLDRLRAAAYSSDSVASVTPFSNNATVCSYPDPLLENSMPKDITLSEIDNICKEVNQGIVIDIPSGIGFCMYMRADAISEVGLLDAERFGQGYGEENDWCIRARDLGWKHLHACNVFVEHIGGVSFGQDKKSSLVEKNLKILTAIYPEYTPIVMDYLQSDPARLPRNRISIRRMKDMLSTAKAVVMHVSHSFGGGIEVFCDAEKIRLSSEGTETITLESYGKDYLLLKFGGLEATYRRTTEMSALVTDLTSLSCSLIHINSDIGFGLDVWDIPGLLNVPFHVTVHDYTSVCPRVNFTIKNGNYCGEPSDPVACNRCISKNGTYAYLDERFINLGSGIKGWREFYSYQLERAEKIFVPDHDVAMRMERYFPELAVEIRPHLSEPSTAIPRPTLDSGEVLKVAVIGAIGPHKGVNILKSCVENADTLGLPLHFTVIGHTSCDQELLSFPNVTITGKYQPEQLQEVIEQHAPHVSLFISPWPETYSYTLSEALAARLWPVVLPIGAQASRVEKLHFGTILPEGVNAEEINSQLIELAFSPESVGPRKKTRRTMGAVKRINLKGNAS